MAPAQTSTNWAGASLSCRSSTPQPAYAALRSKTFCCIQNLLLRTRAIRQPGQSAVLTHSWKACYSSQQKCLSPRQQGSLRSSGVQVAEEQRRMLQPHRARHQAHPSLSRPCISVCERKKERLSLLSPDFPFHSV